MVIRRFQRSRYWLARGFTLIELMVVLAIVALLLTIALPRYFHGVDAAKESALRETLRTVRDAIDKHYGDTGKYPDTLEVLVQKRYLRTLPTDPITESAESWNVIAPSDTSKGKVFDVKSSAPGKSRAGVAFTDM